MEHALKVYLKDDIKTLAASRTDSGVHAHEQVCVFSYEHEIDRGKFFHAMRTLLPESVCIKKIEVVDERFHPINSSKGKAYRYSIWNHPNYVSPFLQNRVWHLRSPLDVAAMERASKVLIGKHDFSSFTATDGCSKTFVRELLEIHFHHNNELLEIWFVGKGFLKQMVRNIVGTLILVGQGKLNETELPAILAARDRKAAGPCAPAQGLTLAKVFYEQFESAELLKSSSQLHY